MPLKIDCGDVELTLNLVFGMRYKLDAKNADERAARLERINRAMEIKPNLEKTVLMQIADHVGYDQDTIEAKINERDEKNVADRKAEEEGRMDMQRRRSGR
jgi:hypothetical protein